MTEVRVIAIGQKMPDWVEAGCQDYLPRFRHQFRVRLEPLAASKRSGDLGKLEHQQRLFERLRPNDCLIALDERGTQFSTEGLAEMLTRWELSGRNLVFAIGGADGWTTEVRERADVLWSLSALVFPHPLVRILVIEQLYRADSVRQGHPYHRS